MFIFCLKRVTGQGSASLNELEFLATRQGVVSLLGLINGLNKSENVLSTLRIYENDRVIFIILLLISSIKHNYHYTNDY